MSVSASKERRSYINGKMQAEPLRDGAFADYEAAKKIAPIEARYRVVLDILSEEELAQYGLPSDYLPPLLLAKWQSAKYICKRIEEIGMTKQDVAACAGIDQTTLSKYASGARAAGLESQNLLPLSYNIWLNHKFCGISDSSRSSVGSYRIASERNIRHQDIRIPVCEES